MNTQGLTSSLTPRRASAYLQRLGLNTPGPPSLNEVHRAHVRGEGLSPHYRFTLKPDYLSDFEAGNERPQTSPDRHFRQTRLCSLAPPVGSLGLSGNRLIFTENGVKTGRGLSNAEARDALREPFGVTW